MHELIERIQQAKSVAAFTGAGVSTLCGVPDFRGPNGLYKQPNAERIFDIDWFRRDPSIYYAGTRELIYGLQRIHPGPVHHALVALERAGQLQGVITQNIDMLHQKAGAQHVLEVHGTPLVHHCIGCGDAKSFDEICAMLEHDPVPHCARCGDVYKPDVTFFGEMLPERAFTAAQQLAEEVDLMLVLGSSLTVHPAAQLPLLARAMVIVNAQPTPYDHRAVLRYSDLAEFADAILGWTKTRTQN